MQTFRVIQPSDILKPFIRYYWILQSSSSGSVSQRTLPMGCASLVFHRGERLRIINRQELQPRSFICGQESGYSEIIATGNIEMIVVVFHLIRQRCFSVCLSISSVTGTLHCPILETWHCLILQKRLKSAKIRMPALI